MCCQRTCLHLAVTTVTVLTVPNRRAAYSRRTLCRNVQMSNIVLLFVCLIIGIILHRTGKGSVAKLAYDEGGEDDVAFIRRA